MLSSILRKMLWYLWSTAPYVCFEHKGPVGYFVASPSKGWGFPITLVSTSPAGLVGLLAVGAALSLSSVTSAASTALSPSDCLSLTSCSAIRSVSWRIAAAISSIDVMYTFIYTITVLPA